MNLVEFIDWEAKTNDTLDFKRIYVDVAGDLLAGIALSEIIYWHLPDKNGDSRLRVYQRGQYWIASTRHEWWDRARITPKQIDRVLTILRDKQIIETKKFKFKGEPTTHIRLLLNPFLQLFADAQNHPAQNPYLPKQAKPISPKSNSPITYKDLTDLLQKGTPVTESIALNPSIKKIVNEKNSDSENENKEVKTNLGQNTVETNEEVDRAIREVWNTKSPGRTQKLRLTLLGQHPPESEDYISNVTPPATANEILQMGDYYRRQYPNAKMVTVPHKMQDWLYKSRDMQWSNIIHKYYMIILDVEIPTDLADHGDYDGILAFLKRYHPNEFTRIQKEFQYIDTELPPATQMMMLRPYTYYKNCMIPIFHVLPHKIFYEYMIAKDMKGMREYLKENVPVAYASIEKAMRDIDQKLDDQT